MLTVARVVLQDGSLKVAHRQRVVVKAAREKAEAMRGFRRSLPLLGLLLQPLASASYDLRDARMRGVGRAGESSVGYDLRYSLPASWVVVPDACFRAGDRVAQVDFACVGPPGLVLVEVKNWHGAFMCRGDAWYRAYRGGWEPCPSPTGQSVRQVRVAIAWLKGVPGLPAGSWIYPVVVFAGGARLYGGGCSVPCFASSRDLLSELRRLPGPVLSQGQVEAIVARLCRG